MRRQITQMTPDVVKPPKSSKPLFSVATSATKPSYVPEFRVTNTTGLEKPLLLVPARTGYFVEISSPDYGKIHMVNVSVVNTSALTLVLSRNEHLAHLDMPVVVFDVTSLEDPRFTAFGFQVRSGHAEVMGPALVVRYGADSLPPPALVFRGEHFSVYHGPNVATIISIPRIPDAVEALINLV